MPTLHDISWTLEYLAMVVGILLLAAFIVVIITFILGFLYIVIAGVYRSIKARGYKLPGE